MQLAVIIFGFVLFLGCMVLHIIIWRVRTPWVSSAVLLLIFLVLPAVVVSIALAAGAKMLGLGGGGLTAALFLHWSLSLAYLASYPAVRAVSPSLDILVMIESSASGRMTEDELKEEFARKRLIGARIDDLMAYRLVRETSSGYRLTPAAVLIVLLFGAYRRVLGMQPGKG